MATHISGCIHAFSSSLFQHSHIITITMLHLDDLPKGQAPYKNIVPDKWTPQALEPKRGDWANYRLFDDDSVQPSKLNPKAIPQFTRLSDQVCAIVIRLNLSNHEIHQL